MLIEGVSGQRVAFEIQYSGLTVEDWLRRHESYRRQGIVDVWLWGHRGRNFKSVGANRVELNAAQRAMVQTGAALLFINPEQRVLAIGMHLEKRLQLVATTARESVESLAVQSVARIELHSLLRHSASGILGIQSERLAALRASTSEVRRHNAQVEERFAAEVALREKDEADRLGRRQREVAPEHARIRELFTAVERWGRSEAHAAIEEYFGDGLRGRIDHYVGSADSPPWLVRWQCVVYFDLIAGQSRTFDGRDAHRAIISRGVNMGQPNASRLIADFLDRLTREEYLRHGRNARGYPVFEPTLGGAWW